MLPGNAVLSVSPVPYQCNWGIHRFRESLGSQWLLYRKSNEGLFSSIFSTYKRSIYEVGIQESKMSHDRHWAMAWHLKNTLVSEGGLTVRADESLGIEGSFDVL